MCCDCTKVHMDRESLCPPCTSQRCLSLTASWSSTHLWCSAIATQSLQQHNQKTSQLSRKAIYPCSYQSAPQIFQTPFKQHCICIDRKSNGFHSGKGGKFRDMLDCSQCSRDGVPSGTPSVLSGSSNRTINASLLSCWRWAPWNVGLSSQMPIW